MSQVSVLMPTYNQGGFIERAIDSLLAQTLTDWELIIVDDGSTDDTRRKIAAYLDDKRIFYHRLAHNVGLGAALNYGLAHSQAELIAYLPSDDVYYADHLGSLVACLVEQPDASLAYSGLRHHYNRSTLGQLQGYSLQLVQVLHHRTDDRWLERTELVTDDLGRMFWSKLAVGGAFVGTNQISCEWVDHPDQLHKLIREPVGGLNPFRQKFNIQYPLRFHTSVGNFIDEVEYYRPFRERPPTPPATDRLKILLVGELAYNSERVLALEERGHALYGLWMPDPYWYNTVGPLPFGHVEDISSTDWPATVRELQPDVIYGLLNWQAVPFAHEVMRAFPDIPFVWHFKEGPFICLEKGSWSQLIELYTRSDGQIYTSPAMRDWFYTVVPGLKDGLSMVLDGDLPKREWFKGELSPRLSEGDGEFHTVVPGRPIGLHPHTVGELAAQSIHLHFYGDFTHGQWVGWIEKARQLAPGYLHLHPNVTQEGWVREFSRYDAGWLHFFESANGGELRRANWDDLNYPARLATLVAAGLPVLQRDNTGSIVATQQLVQQLDIGLFFEDMAGLQTQLAERERMGQLYQNVWRQRDRFTFDYYADDLLTFFRTAIAAKSRA